jgi:hypothetical protein
MGPDSPPDTESYPGLQKYLFAVEAQVVAYFD